MTTYIKKLPADLINQISAGEVIERPASAVKELIENSIDAGANKIQVQLLSSDGRSFRVTDNGCGIPPEEIELAFTDHATSKISSLDDLTHVLTKGFRGEALASIAAVSKVTCSSKHINSDTAYKASFDSNGKLQKIPTALTGGTSFEIHDLFSNVPVRLKFLKKAETEVTAIQDVVREAALAHPEISFDLQIKDKIVFKTSGNGDWMRTVKEVFSDNTNFKYLEVTREEEPFIQVKGLVAPLSEARSDAKSIVTLVNQRAIQCQILRKAIKNVYSGFLPSGKYPRIILSVSLPPEQIDVNVHPTKREVRYASPSLVYQFVQNSLEKHLIIQSSLSLAKPTQVVNDTSYTEENEAISQRSFLKPKEETTEKIYIEPREKSQSFEIFENKSTNLESANPVSATYSSKSFSVASLELKTESSNSEQSFRADRGNSSQFRICNGNLSLNGQINGDKTIRESFLSAMHDWLFKLDLQERDTNEQQLKTFTSFQNIKRRSVPSQTLERVWERDNWRCVYCGKTLMHPGLVKRALREDVESWTQRISKGNKIIKSHLFREHQASYDHYLPVSHNPSLGLNEDNLFACCRSCNQEKSNTTNTSKWQPKKHEKLASFKIGKTKFYGSDTNAKFEVLLEKSAK